MDMEIKENLHGDGNKREYVCGWVRMKRVFFPWKRIEEGRGDEELRQMRYGERTEKVWRKGTNKGDKDRG